MILKDPNPTLHTKCAPVSILQGKRIAKRLRESYIEARDNSKDTFVVGLAAPQIGIPKNVFVALGDVFINPRIISLHKSEINSEEGCLSLPDIYRLKRYKSVKITWTDEARRQRIMTLEGKYAVIIQHEYDHLMGKLCSEHAAINEFQTKVEKIKREIIKDNLNSLGVANQG